MRFIAFESSAANLVPDDTTAVNDVFIADRAGARIAYGYDPAGNRASQASGGTTTYSYDRADRILAVQGPPVAASSTRPPA